MNFEYQIEQELKRLEEVKTKVVDNSWLCHLSGEIEQDLTKTRLINVCNPRENINGGLWDVQTTIGGLMANAVDTSGATLQEVYSVIADIVNDIKADPSLLNATIGTLTSGLTAGVAITELPVTFYDNDEVNDNLPATGSVKLVNTNGDTEDISYTAFDAGAGTFTVSHTPSYDYASGDKVKDKNLYCVDGVVNQQQSSTPLQLGEIRAIRQLTVLLKVSYTP